MLQGIKKMKIKTLEPYTSLTGPTVKRPELSPTLCRSVSRAGAGGCLWQCPRERVLCPLNRLLQFSHSFPDNAKSQGEQVEGFSPSSLGQRSTMGT